MRESLTSIAWKRFSVISSVMADVNSRGIAVIFYFTIFLPFGLISTVFSDPLRRKKPPKGWLTREPVPTDINSARQQG